MNKKTPKQLYWKLFRTYTLISVGIAAALVVYFIINTKGQIQEKSLKYMQKVGEDASREILRSSDKADNMLADLYKSNTELQDVISYLTEDITAYLKHRLDAFSASSSASYNGIDDFAFNAMEESPQIKSIRFVSYPKEELTVYTPDGKVSRREVSGYLRNQLDEKRMEQPLQYEFLKEIRDPVTLENIGCMMVFFQNAGLADAWEYFERCDLLVYSSFGNLVFDSSGRGDAKKMLLLEDTRQMEEELKAFVNYRQVKDFHVAASIGKFRADKMPAGLWATIILIGLSIVTLGIVFIHFYLIKLTGRLDGILDGMERVTKGDLDVRLKVDEEKDELDVIAEHFNEMCVELNHYIQKSYLAQIEQKNAEMAALQSQINPHFLYNTLESIRMKAICNGDREVGKMLYGLAVIFRSQIKDTDIITLAKELHYCKKYLELFEFRYQNKFQFEIDCPEAFVNIPVIKFIIQPVIENYLVHGIRLEDSDNRICIEIKEDSDDMLIVVSDNGYGMKDEAITDKNRELNCLCEESKGSIGIQNVNLRMRAAYGKGYGVLLEANQPAGLRVNLRFPLKGAGYDEKSNVS